MKKFQLAIYALLLSLAIISCKKISQIEDLNFDLQQKSSIQNYLKSQKANNSPNRIKQIEKLSENLLFDKLWVEKSYAHNLIITPIDELYMFSNNKGNNVSKHFVCVVDSTSKIVTSYIVQNRPSNNIGKTDIKKGAVANIEDNKPVEEDCNIRYINIYDYYLYEKNYKNNILISTLNLNTKPKGKSSISASTTGCNDYYWVTTYPDGSQTWEYLYTSCGNCSMPNPNDQTLLCDDGGGGGGGTPDLGEPTSRNVDLVVKEITTGSQAKWKMLGTFKISGVKFTNTANNYFTSISHLGAVVINYNPAYDGLPNMTPYFEFTSSNSCGLIGTTVAKGTVNGFMYYPILIPPETHLYPKDGFWHSSTDLY